MIATTRQARMLLPFVALTWVATSAGVSADDCTLGFVDDRGEPIKEILTICSNDGAEERCVEWEAGSGTANVGSAGNFRVEGDDHGPVVARLSPQENKVCLVTVPRKASVSIGFDSQKTRLLATSFYRTDRDPNLYRPEDRVSLEAPTILKIASGEYLISLAERGRAPDLRLLKIEPGSVHELEHRRLDGWSVVIRTASDSDNQPVAGAEVSLRTIPGFDLGQAVEGRVSRPLATKASNVDGWVSFSGLKVPLAGAAVQHPEFLDAEIPAFSSEPGTFRVFETRLFEGGKLAVRIDGLEVLEEELGAKEMECGLFPPDTSEEKAFADSYRLVEMKADGEGVCRASRIPGGSYALKVALAGEDDAYTVEPVFIVEGQTALSTIELRPIRISGRVYKGSEGAPGYEVSFGRAEEFHEGGAVFPVGKPAVSDEDGDYEVMLWSAGRYMALVTNSTTMAGLPQVVDIRGDYSLDFEVANLAIEGRVVDEYQSPLPEANLRVRLNGLTRKVLLDEEGRFEIPFDSESQGVAELVASAVGFHDSPPSKVEVRTGAVLDPVELVLRSRDWRPGRLILASGLPAAGAWVSVHRLGSPPQYIPSVERVLADGDGKFEIPREDTVLRLFFGGAGCPLGFFDLPPISNATVRDGGGTEDPGILVTCTEPGHLMVRLVSDDPELKDRVPIILRRDGITIPQSALEGHLAGLGLPTMTDGQGRLGLVALEPGTYELFHGKATSPLNVAAHADMALLSKVHLDARVTVELEAVVDLR